MPVAPLTNGQKTALYLLLTSRSELRLALEGKAHEGSAPTGTAADPDALAKMLGDLVTTRFNIIQAQFNMNTISSLFDPNGKDPQGNITKVTTSAKLIRQALDMNGPYPPDDPCPPFANQTLIFNAVSKAIPAVSVAELQKLAEK